MVLPLPLIAQTVTAIDKLYESLAQMISTIILYIPNVIAAAIIIGIGYLIGEGVARAVNKLIDKTLEPSFDKTDIGRAFKESGIDLSDLTGMLVKAFIVVIAVVIAIPVLNITGYAGELLSAIAVYLPKLIAGVFILTYGIILVSILASYVGKLVIASLPKEQAEVGQMLKNVLLVGLVALVIAIALNTMELSGQYVYPLILGFMVIALGIFIGTTVIRNIEEDHPEFREYAAFAKFMVYIMFIIVGIAAIFSAFPGTTVVIANIAWGVAIAFGIMLVPIVYALAKKLVR